MAYKVKSSKKPDYAELELKHFREEHKHKKYKFTEFTREGTRRIMHVPENTHKKGNWVVYDERLHIVNKVSPRGVWLQPYSETREPMKEKDKAPKKIFIKEKDYEKQVEPVFIPVPFYFAPITVMK
jgi:hypothetical protein